MNKRLINTFGKAAGFVLMLGAALSFALVYAVWRDFKPPDAAGKSTVQPERPGVAVPSAEDWRVFSVSTPQSEPLTRDASLPYRLAGTFEAFGDREFATRRAVLDDLRDGTQVLVSEGDRHQELLVLNIYSDRARIRINDREVVLHLGFSDPEEAAPLDSAVSEEHEDELEASGFGRQVGENRWVIRKQALLDYYERLRDDPERLVNLYEAFRPLYTEENTIGGYQLDVDLEPELLEAAGLNQDDVVRAVNSMAMTARQRGEYFVREFIQGRLSVVVLDIERQGQAQKLIYMIR